jgi:hypothetical protein
VVQTDGTLGISAALAMVSHRYKAQKIAKTKQFFWGF